MTIKQFRGEPANPAARPRRLARVWLAAGVLAAAGAAGVAGAQMGEAPAESLREAAALVREGRTEEATALLERLKAEFPGDPAPYNELAAIHARRGDFEGARALLESALAAAPRYRVVYGNLQAVLGELAAKAYREALFEGNGAAEPVVLASLADREPAPRLALQAASPAEPAPAAAVEPEPDPVPDPEPAAAVEPEPDPVPDPEPEPVAVVAPAREARPVAVVEPEPAPAPPPAAPAALPAAVEVEPAPVQPRRNPVRLAAAARPGPDAAALRAAAAAVVEDWARAWSARDVDAYLAFYARDFRPAGGLSRPRWVAQRRSRVGGPRFIEVELRDLDVTLDAPGRAEVRFRQSYRSDRLRSTVTKRLRLVRESGAWKIVEETVLR